MKKIPCVTLLLFLTPFFLFSQLGYPIKNTETLKKNKDISWIGETEFTYFLEDYDRLNFKPPHSNQEETRTIKIDPIATCKYDHERFFTYYMIAMAKEGNLKLTSPEGSPMNGEDITSLLEVSSLDTIVTFDPETYKEKLQIVRSSKLFEINAFKIQQWWFYNKNTNSLQSIVKAVGPVLKAVNEKKNLENGKALFWIEMEQLPGQSFDYNNPNVVWAKETLSSLSFKNTKKIKGNTDRTLKNLTFKDPKKGKANAVENDGWYSYCQESIGEEEINKLLAASKDTIITFDPETYKEDITIVKNAKVSFKDIEYFRVLQHWYFDQSTNQLASKVISIGPLQNIFDEKGVFKYRRALYYIPSSE